MKIVLKKWIDRLLDLILWAAGLVALWIAGQVFLFASFRIPSDSMEPTLEAGDFVLVNKLLVGPRLFNLSEAMEGKRVEIHRLPGLHRIARNDVLVFHFPHPETWERIEMHLLKYYVKRCIALPGDTLSIHQGHYHIAGYDGALGNEAAQNRMERMGEADFSPEVYASFPYDSLLGWNIREFGPLYVPKAGDEIEMDRSASRRITTSWAATRRRTRKTRATGASCRRNTSWARSGRYGNPWIPTRMNSGGKGL